MRNEAPIGAPAPPRPPERTGPPAERERRDATIAPAPAALRGASIRLAALREALSLLVPQEAPAEIRASDPAPTAPIVADAAPVPAAPVEAPIDPAGPPGDFYVDTATDERTAGLLARLEQLPPDSTVRIRVHRDGAAMRAARHFDALRALADARRLRITIVASTPTPLHMARLYDFGVEEVRPMNSPGSTRPLSQIDDFILDIAPADPTAEVIAGLAALPRGARVWLNLPEGAQAMQTPEDFEHVRVTRDRRELLMTIISPEPRVIHLAEIYEFGAEYSVALQPADSIEDALQRLERVPRRAAIRLVAPEGSAALRTRDDFARLLELRRTQRFEITIVTSDPVILSVAPVYGCAVEDARGEQPAEPAPLMAAAPAPPALAEPAPAALPAAAGAEAPRARHLAETEDTGLVPGATLADLDLVRLADYLAQAGAALTAGLPFHLALEQMLAERRIIRSVEDIPQPTIAGLLMFGKEPQAFEPGLIISFLNYYAVGADGAPAERLIDERLFDGPIPEMVENATAEALASLRKSRGAEGPRRHDTREYPREAIREAVLNALAHRDYGPHTRDRPVELRLYPNRLEVESPGRLMPPVTEANLEWERARRNPVLLELMEDLRLVTNRGAGVRAMVAAMRGATLEPPRLQERDDSFLVILHNHRLMNQGTLAWLNQLAESPLNPEQRLALAYLRHNDEITSVEYQRLNQVNGVTAERDLRALVVARLLAQRTYKGRVSYMLAAPLETDGPAPPQSDEEMVIAHVRAHGFITGAEGPQVLGAVASHAEYILHTMKERGLLRLDDSGRGVRYVLP
jgi:predicted HTH transcriptional regulator